MENIIDLIYLGCLSIGCLVMGWKFRNSKVDKNTIMPGHTLEEVMHRRKVGGTILMVTGGILLIITLLMGFLILA